MAFWRLGQCMPKSCHGLTIWLPTLVLIAQAIFLLDRGCTNRQTNKRTDKCDWMPYPTPAAIQLERVNLKVTAITKLPRQNTRRGSWDPNTDGTASSLKRLLDAYPVRKSESKKCSEQSTLCLVGSHPFLGTEFIQFSSRRGFENGNLQWQPAKTNIYKHRIVRLSIKSF